MGAWSHENCKLACPCGEALLAPPASSVTPAAVSTPVTPVSPQSPVCTWKQPPACAPEFTYKGNTYSGCAIVDSAHAKPWCQHHYQHTDTGPGVPQDWSYCTYSCALQPDPSPKPDEDCKWIPAPSCIDEFDY